jgi:hypothetical protein
MRGKVGDRVFYKMRGNFYVRRNDEARGERLKSDPRFAKVREANSLFGVGSRLASFLYREAKALGAVDYRRHGELCGQFNLYLGNFKGRNYVTSKGVLTALQKGFSLGKEQQLIDFKWMTHKRVLQFDGLQQGSWQLEVRAYKIADFEKQDGKYRALGGMSILTEANYCFKAEGRSTALGFPVSADVLLLVLRNASGELYSYLLSPSPFANDIGSLYDMNEHNIRVLLGDQSYLKKETCLLAELPP